MDNFNLILTIFFLIIGGLFILDAFWLARKLRTKSGFSIKPRDLVRNRKFWLNVSILGGIIMITPLLYTRIQPRIIGSTPGTETVWESYSEPLEVFFNTPVEVGRLTVNMNPEVKGEWHFTPFLGIGRLTTYGYFIPEETLFPGQRIVVYITGIGRLGNRTEGHEFGFVFDSVKLPEFSETIPENNTEDVRSDDTIVLKLNRPSSNLVDWSFALEPETEFETTFPDASTIELIPQKGLDLSTTYTLQAFRRAKRINLITNEVIEQDNPELIHEIKFETQREPLVRSFFPRGNAIKADSQIKIRFMTDMDQQSVENNLVTDPEITGEFVWSDSRTLEFTPSKELEKESVYKVTLKQGIRSILGISSTEDINYEFKTIGYIQISKTEPAKDQVKVSESADIKVTFNQEVDHESAQSKFSISPGISGSFSWDENTMIFNPNGNLSFSTQYNFVLKRGIKSLFGYDSNEEFSFNFTVRSNEVVISMPLYYQPQYPVSFSCNIYAAKMALAWKGYNTTVSGLISEIGNDPSTDGQGRWLGDPNADYIGNGDGSWGYGVYWNPVQQMFTNRGIKTVINQNWNVRDLARSIEAGRPVVIWRYNGTSVDKNLEWGSPGVYAINGQHGGVVSGFRGTPENPTAFYINDPWFGLIWMNVTTFDYYWSRLNRVGLVVY